MSRTVDTNGWGMFWERVTGPVGGPDAPSSASEIEVGGHVEKKPAVLEASELEALMMVAPGWAAVARPSVVMLTMEAVEEVNWSGPTRQLMLLWAEPVPA